MEKRGTKQEREARRFRAVAMLAEGRRGCEVARVLKVTAGAVSQWKSAHELRGDDALRSKPHPGGAPKLSEEDRHKLPKVLVAGPRAHGFATDLWTLQRVAEVIHRKFGVRYHPAHVWKMLTGMGWTCQKPERRARERDEDAVARWRSQDWPRIKKGRAKAAGPSSSWTNPGSCFSR